MIPALAVSPKAMNADAIRLGTGTPGHGGLSKSAIS